MSLVELGFFYLRYRGLRAVYVVVTIIIVFICYTLLAAIGSPFSATKTPISTTLGNISIGLLGGSPLGTGLPASYAQEIAAMAGIRSVYFGNYMPIDCRGGVNAILNGQGAINGPTESEIPLSPTEREAWRRERNAVIVGYILAKRCHWRKGMFLTVRGVVGARPVFKIHIVAVYHANSRNPVLNQVADAHFRYLDRLKPSDEQGDVMWMSAKVANPHQAAHLATIIDAHFANRSPPTYSSTATASQGALAQFGNVLKIIEFVMAAVFACTLLVTLNVAAHAIAERRSQFVLLRLFGFTRTWLTGLVLTELLYVVALGCGLGLAFGLALLHWVVKPALGPVFSSFFTVPVSALILAPALAAGIVLISTLIPVWEIFRLRAARLTSP